MSQHPISRRGAVRVALGATGALVLAACGAPATPTPAPIATARPTAAPSPSAGGATGTPGGVATATPAGAATKPAGTTATPATRATTAAGSATTPSAGATTTPVAQATTPATRPAAGGQLKGPLTIWQGQDYIEEVTTLQKAIFEDWARTNGVQLVFEEKTGNWNDQLLAAVQAGTPPDIHRVFDYQAQYWRAQNQAVDVSDVVGTLRTVGGGYFDYVEATDAWQGKWWAVPFAVNAWPMHVRQDLLDAKGVKWPTSWDEFRAAAKQVQSPPSLYGFGYSLGKNNDTNNHFIALLWTFGGQLQTADGKLAASAGDKGWLEALRLTKAMYEEDRIIPPGAVTWDDGGNNNAYEGGQLLATSNPTSIYTWLVSNDKSDLVKGTKFYPYPKGPAGEFGQVDVWAQMIFKASKVPDSAKSALGHLMSKDVYARYITDLKGRFLPVYKGMLDDPMWKANPLYENYVKIAQNGRVMAYAASPTAPYSDITTTFVIGDMLQDLLVKKEAPEKVLGDFVARAKTIYAKYPTL
jgi:multiple sugar transport system substrate-binding protein